LEKNINVVKVPCIMSIKIRSYEPGEEREIISLWNRCLTRDPISLEVFERKVLLDPNFEAEGFLLAEEDGKLLGFAYNIVRKYPILREEVEKDKERGWIVAFGVAPEARETNVGDRLIQASIDFHRERRKKIILYSPYVPNYFFPGIDAEAYPHEYEVLLRNGFTEIKGAEGLAMDTSLWPDFKYPADIKEREERLKREGIEIKVLTTQYLYPLMKFLEKHMPADWYRHARELLLHNRKTQVFVAVKGREVVGYCQFWGGEGYEWYMPGSHFGPFGVREDMRGKGIGTMLLYKCLEAMKENGIHNAFLLWTGEKAKRLYERFGFKVTRVFKLMKKNIEA